MPEKTETKGYDACQRSACLFLSKIHHSIHAVKKPNQVRPESLSQEIPISGTLFFGGGGEACERSFPFGVSRAFIGGAGRD